MMGDDQFGIDKGIINFIARYGPCYCECVGDTCQKSGLPCDFEERKVAIKSMLEALKYGIKHKFIVFPYQSEESAPKFSTSQMVQTAQHSYDIGKSTMTVLMSDHTSIESLSTMNRIS